MRRIASQTASRFYTGPLGHLYGGVADWLEFLGRHLWAQARARAAARLGR